MNWLKKIFSQPTTWFLIISIVYLSPNLLSPHFSYIDDGQSLLSAKTVFESNGFNTWKNTLFESSLGRIRPFYQLYFIALYLIAGVNPFVFWLGQTIVLFLTLWGAWLFLTSFSEIKKRSSFILLSLFILFPATIDNFYRLGTAEPRQVLGIIWFLVWLRKLKINRIIIKDYLIGHLLLVFSLGTKETSLLLFPIIGLFFFVSFLVEKKQEIRKNILLLSSSLFVQGIIFYLLMPKNQGYGSSMSISIPRLWYSALVTRLEFAEFYLPLLIVILLMMVRFIFNGFKNIKIIGFLKESIWSGILLLGLAESLFFVWSWQYQLERYHYLPLFFGLLLVAHEISQWNKQLFNKLKKQLFVFVLVPISLLYIFFFQLRGLNWNGVFQRSYKYYSFHYTTYQTAGELIDFLYMELPENTNVYIDHDDYEKIADLGYFASNFGDREITIYSGNREINKRYPDLHFYETNLLDAYDQENDKKILILFDSSKNRFFEKIIKNF